MIRCGESRKGGKPGGMAGYGLYNKSFEYTAGFSAGTRILLQRRFDFFAEFRGLKAAAPSDLQADGRTLNGTQREPQRYC